MNPPSLPPEDHALGASEGPPPPTFDIYGSPPPCKSEARGDGRSAAHIYPASRWEDLASRAPMGSARSDLITRTASKACIKSRVSERRSDLFRHPFASSPQPIGGRSPPGYGGKPHVMQASSR